MAQTRESQIRAQKCPDRNKAKEVSVVSPSDAIVQPDTMMVLRFYTVVADPTMMRSGRSPDVARFTVLDRIVHGSVT